MKPTVTLKKVNIVAEHYEESLAFYRLLGLSIPEVLAKHANTKHAPALNEDGSFAIDNSELASIYNAGWRQGKNRKSVLLTAQVESRRDVDQTFNTLVSAGHSAVQVPYDAFWGSRYAIVMDPEGNWVGIESPSDESMRSWPPRNSPDGD
jgi:uncharacterized glyoxalase superfamily protein PhnB